MDGQPLVQRRLAVTGPVGAGPAGSAPAGLRDRGTGVLARVLSQPSAPVWCLIAVLAAVSGAIAAWVLPDLAPGVAAPHVPLLLLAGLFAGAEVVRVHLHFRGEAHTFAMTDVVLVLGLVFSAPLDVLVASVLGGALARLVIGRQVAVKQAFNLVIAAVDACVAVLVFRLVVELPVPAEPRTWLAAAAATSATTVVSTVLVAVAIALSERQFERGVLLTTMGPALAITGVNAALGLLLAVVLHEEPRAAALLVLPVALAVVAYRAYTSQVEERQRVEVLLACGQLLHTDEPLARRLDAGLELARTALRARSLEVVIRPDLHVPLPPYAVSGSPAAAEERLVGLQGLAELVADGVTRRHDGQRGDALLHAQLTRLRVAQGIVVPLRTVDTVDTVVGALVALDRLGEVSRYSRQDQRLLDAVAEQVAVTLQREALTDTVHQLNTAHAALRDQANHDPLTGLANRRQLMEGLNTQLERWEAGGHAPALVLFDLDRFKQVNDEFGHATGDALLRVVASRLAAACRPGDLPARLGGDEFVVLLAGPLSSAEAEERTHSLQRAVCSEVVVDGHQILVHASFGLTMAGDSSRGGAAQVLQRADHAMYAAKRAHDGSVSTWSDADQAYEADQRNLRRDLAAALVAKQVYLAYQPVVNVLTGAVVGVEALARWQHPERGAITPDEFIPLAERTGLIVPLGRHVLLEACRQLAVWQRTDPRKDLSMAVNVSVKQLVEPALIEEFAEIVRSTGADPSRLVLEITESEVLSDDPTLLAFLHWARRRGVRVAIDDFGSGYASVNHLRRLPVDILKLDRTLVQGALHAAADVEICRSIVSLAAALQLTVIAEGVENAEHAEVVAGLGCQLVQGYHYGRPGPASAVDSALLDADLARLSRPVESTER